jgi:kumamolisin
LYHRILKPISPVVGSIAALILLTVVAAAPAEAANKGNQYAQAMVKLAHPAGLEKFAKSVSSPNSRNYQRYRRVGWIVKRFGAKPKVKRRALRWFEGRGMHAAVDGSGQNLLVTMTAGQAEAFLGPDASSSSLRHGGAGSVPDGLKGLATSLIFLDPDPDRYSDQGKFPPQPAGSQFPADSSARPHSGTQTGCAAGQRGTTAVAEQNRNFTPNQFLDAYGISRLHKQGTKGQGRRIALIEIDGFKRADIETYGACYGKRVPPTHVHPVYYKKPLAPGAETTLDLEVITAVAPRLEGIDVYEGPGSEAGIMLMVSRALAHPKKPDAISISLGACEPSLWRQMAYRRGLGNLFAVAAGAGISVAVAAGDNGSAECSSNGNSSTLPLLTASDPASSEWVTAVGGTNLELNDRNQIVREFVWNEGSLGPSGGGGGFSILAHRRPWYQQGTKRFHGFGLSRALPDVSALADSIPGYSVYCTAPGASAECENRFWPEGGWQPVGGTSAATPLTASLLTLVSQRLQKAGRKRIGFANPLLYKIGKSKRAKSVFRDVVAGNNDVGAAIPVEAGGGKPLGCCYTKTGFDAASGWGSIKAPGLLKAAMKMTRRKKN